MTSISTENKLALTKLRLSWLMTAIIWIAVFFFVYRQLKSVWAYADRWALIACLVLAFNLWLCWRGLPDNHRQGEEKLLPTLGLGNMLTISRGLAMGLLAGFLFSPWPEGILAWEPALLYSVVVLADHFDGYLARMTNQITVFGGKLDVEFDSLGILIIIGVAIWYGRLPWWYLSIGLARYLFLIGIWYRGQLDWPVYELPPSTHRRLIATFQMAFLMIALWPVLPTTPVRLAGIAIGIPIMVGFLRDWLIVIGHLDPQSPTYRKRQRWLFIALAKWLPLLLRLIVVLAMLMIYSRGDLPQAWADFLSTSFLPWPTVLASLVTFIGFLTSIAMALGLAARIPAGFALLPLSLDIMIHGLYWYNGLALWSLIWIMVLGMGYFSLWQPQESTFLLRYE